jgi:hypothetical protein
MTARSTMKSPMCTIRELLDEDIDLLEPYACLHCGQELTENSLVVYNSYIAKGGVYCNDKCLDDGNRDFELLLAPEFLL